MILLLDIGVYKRLINLSTRIYKNFLYSENVIYTLKTSILLSEYASLNLAIILLYYGLTNMSTHQ